MRLQPLIIYARCADRLPSLSPTTTFGELVYCYQDELYLFLIAASCATSYVPSLLRALSSDHTAHTGAILLDDGRRNAEHCRALIEVKMRGGLAMLRFFALSLVLA